MTKEELKNHVHEWAAKMNVTVGEVHLRAMKTKWASMSADRRLTLDSSLLDLSEMLCDYIIVHELVHLKVRNHGKLFKSLMFAYLPGWEELVLKLKAELEERVECMVKSSFIPRSQ